MKNNEDGHFSGSNSVYICVKLACMPVDKMGLYKTVHLLPV